MFCNGFVSKGHTVITAFQSWQSLEGQTELSGVMWLVIDKSQFGSYMCFLSSQET